MGLCYSRRVQSEDVGGRYVTMRYMCCVGDEEVLLATRGLWLRGGVWIDRASAPSLLIAAAVANCAVVFGLLVAYGRPGLGVGQGFYLSVVLASLATGPAWGAVAGVCAVVVYVCGLVLGGSLAWSGVLSEPIGIRLASYVAAGSAVGYVARRGRRLLTESLRILEQLLTVAGRDLTTATLGSGGLEVAIGRLLASGEPFVLLAADVRDGVPNAAPALSIGRSRDGDERARSIAALLGAQLSPGDELARLGPNRFAILASARCRSDAVATIDFYRRGLADVGLGGSFGWAAFPDDGAETLALFSIAIERLHGDLGAGGSWTPALPPAS
jgi:hypothetical protein